MTLANNLEPYEFVIIVSHPRDRQNKFSRGLGLNDICNKQAVRYCDECAEYLNIASAKFKFRVSNLRLKITEYIVNSIIVIKLFNYDMWKQRLRSFEHDTLGIYERRETRYNFIIRVNGRRNSKVTATNFWNAKNRGLTNLRDLGNPSTAATFWDSKCRLGNRTSIRVRCL